MYNVHLPIMLESERQAVYRERKKERKKENPPFVLCIQKDYDQPGLLHRLIRVFALSHDKVMCPLLSRVYSEISALTGLMRRLI